MPKTIPLADKREWLKLYEEGRAEASIAADAQRDVKTIKKGINDARLERDSAAARSQLITEALRRHHNTLGAIVQEIVSALKLPSHDVEIRRNQDGTHATTPLPGGARIEYNPAAGLVVLLKDEGTPHWDLLREHLKRDRLWGLLDHWKAAMKAHMQTRTALKGWASSLLQDSTGLNVRSETSKNQEGGYVFTSAVQLFYEVALKRAIGIPDATNLEENLVATSEDYVIHAGGRVAYCPDATEQCKDKMVEAFGKLLGSVESRQATETNTTLEQATDKAKRPVEEIALLGLIPGHCRVCRRLGI